MRCPTRRAATQGVVGTANVFTATICVLTNNQPGAVCSDPVIQAIQGKLK